MNFSHSKGATLIEVAVAIVVLSICTVAGFSVFSMSQTQMINAIYRSQLVEVAQNEAERILSIKYDLVVTQTGQTIIVGDRTYTVNTVVSEINPAADPHWKQVDITAIAAVPAETFSLRVLKSP